MMFSTYLIETSAVEIVFDSNSFSQNFKFSSFWLIREEGKSKKSYSKTCYIKSKEQKRFSVY